jgi:probable phosphoglycerate mutase
MSRNTAARSGWSDKIKLYFVRHGESEANVLRVISNRGWLHPLTEKGRQQARDLAGKLQTAGIARIYTSPLQRAVQTAEILSQTLGVEVEITGALREFDCGIAESRADAQAWQLWQTAWDSWMLHQQWDYRVEGGESFNDLRSRFLPLVNGLLRDYTERPESYVLIGHGGLYYTMLPQVLVNLPPHFDGTFPNTGYVLAEASPEGLVCLEWCGTKIDHGEI